MFCNNCTIDFEHSDHWQNAFNDIKLMITIDHLKTMWVYFLKWFMVTSIWFFEIENTTKYPWRKHVLLHHKSSLRWRPLYRMTASSKFLPNLSWFWSTLPTFTPKWKKSLCTLFWRLFTEVTQRQFVETTKLDYKVEHNMSCCCHTGFQTQIRSFKVAEFFQSLY